jgi:glycosyltransferase involved in cell wall biosynthesis
MLSAMLVAPFLPKADVVLSTSPQFFNGLGGYFVSRMKRCPWVLEIRDLWPESILVVGAITNRAVIRMLEYLEVFAYRKADRIVVVTDAFKRYIIEKGIDAEKIEVIKNGVDLGFYEPATRDQAIAKEFGLQGKFVASYFGTHGMAHHLETILEAAQELQRYPEIVFLLVGEGAERNRLSVLCNQLRLKNVVMVGQQPKGKMPALWALSDVSLVLLKKSDLFKTVIPSKIFESMAMEKPIILGVEGESQAIIQTAEAGLCIEPENARELAARVLELYSDRDLRTSLGRNGRRCVAEQFNREVLAQRYKVLIASVVDA